MSFLKYSEEDLASVKLVANPRFIQGEPAIKRAREHGYDIPKEPIPPEIDIKIDYRGKKAKEINAIKAHNKDYLSNRNRIIKEWDNFNRALILSRSELEKEARERELHMREVEEAKKAVDARRIEEAKRVEESRRIKESEIKYKLENWMSIKLKKEAELDEIKIELEKEKDKKNMIKISELTSKIFSLNREIKELRKIGDKEEAKKMELERKRIIENIEGLYSHSKKIKESYFPMIYEKVKNLMSKFKENVKILLEINPKNEEVRPELLKNKEYLENKEILKTEYKKLRQIRKLLKEKRKDINKIWSKIEILYLNKRNPDILNIEENSYKIKEIINLFNIEEIDTISKCFYESYDNIIRIGNGNVKTSKDGSIPDSFYQKYLKYKLKYLDLKKLIK
jgi:hypothetical protein